MQRRIIIALFLMSLLLITQVAGAQDGNLLRDGGMEGSYTARGRVDFNFPADWNIWYASAPHTEDWMNLQPVAFPHNGPGPNPQSGSRALNMNRGYATFTAAVYQQVTVTANANLVASAWAYLKTCNLAPGFDNCGSAVESGAYTRIGVDPSGGTDPNSPGIVWSGNSQPHDRWEQMTVSATAAGTSVTVFLYVTQRWPSDLNNVYFDSASLTVGGAGGSSPAGSPAATPVPQTVPFVVAQGENDDGSIVHHVQSGDTLDSIAVAYGVTRQDIMALNNITDPRIIQIGQELIIRPPTNEQSDSGSEAEVTDEPAATDESVTDEAAVADEGSEDTAPEQGAVETNEPTGESETSGETTDETAPASEPAAESAPPLDIAALPPAPVRSSANGGVRPAVDPSEATGQVCVLMFDDANQNRLQDADETLLSGGSVILVQGGNAVADRETDGTEPYCFNDLAAGDYVASVAAPDGYGLTTPDQLSLRVASGSGVTVALGAAQNVQPLAPPPADAGAPLAESSTETQPPASNSILDNLGLIALAAGALALVVGGAVTLVLRRR
ncbi:MAG: LysM peptidoglycan-binding domain-containing protein [Anaerolineae bacterium]|nr:LysM peptidoglycan-binding domain-containing protein [Anaerolineae bacterium]